MPSEGEPSSGLDERQRADRLDAALAGMDPAKRQLLVLYEIEELTLREIGEILDLPINTVFSRLKVARAQLASAYRRGERRERRLG